MQCESLTFSWTHALRSGPESFASFCKRRICCCPTKNPCYLDILINLYRSLLNSACARRRLRRAVPLCLDPPGSPFNFFKTDPDSHRIWWSLTSFKRIFQKFCSVSGECIGLPPGSFIFSFKSSTSGYLGWWKLLAPQHHHCHDVFALLYWLESKEHYNRSLQSRSPENLFQKCALLLCFCVASSLGLDLIHWPEGKVALWLPWDLPRVRLLLNTANTNRKDWEIACKHWADCVGPWCISQEYVQCGQRKRLWRKSSRS